MTAKELRNKLRNSINRDDYYKYIGSIAKETGLDYRTVRELSVMTAYEFKLPMEDFEILSNPETYTKENCIRFYKKGLIGLIPTELFEDKEFLQTCGITKLPDYFCEGNYDLESFHLCSEIQEIPAAAFNDCMNLGYVHFEHPCTLKRIGKRAFAKTVSLKEFEFCEGLEVIDKFAFFLSSINKAVFPSSLNSIGSSAFRVCRGMRHVEFKGKTSLQEAAFSSCIRLQKVAGAYDLYGSAVFSNCSALKEITSCSGVIPEDTFSGCCNLKNIYFSKTPYAFEKGAFNDCELESASFGEYRYQLLQIKNLTELGNALNNEDTILVKYESVHEVLKTLNL